MLDAINKGRANGNGNMAAGLVEGGDAEAVAQFVAVAVGSRQVARLRVHPAASGKRVAPLAPFRRTVRKDVVRVGTSVGL